MPQAIYLPPVSLLYDLCETLEGGLGLQAFPWIANHPKEVWKSRSNHTGDNRVAILPPPTILHDQTTSTNSTSLAALTYTANWTASTSSTDLTANTWANWLTCVKQHHRLFCFSQHNQQNCFHQLNRPTLTTKPTELNQQPQQTQETCACGSNQVDVTK